MATILVVDDSAVDRQVVGGLLQQVDDMRIQYAEHGVEAMACIEKQTPDLVVTDLTMPEMDGLELVATIRKTSPLIPVILMTSRGSEEIAVAALQAGAASYVPKHVLARKLVATVRNVLAVSGQQRYHSRLMGCMARSEYTFDLDNDSTLFATLVAYLLEELSRMDLCDETGRTRVGVALEEALANALYHGNLEVGSELRGEDDQAYFELIERRRRESPYQQRRIHVEVALARDMASFTIRDEGAGFDPSALPDPTDPDNLEKASGRGVLLMRTFMDEVTYNDIGNSVALIKHREPNKKTTG